MSAALRRAVIATARTISGRGLSVALSGNVSARSERGFLITPTGATYESLQPSDIVEMSVEGEDLDRNRPPSSEWRFHAALYANRPEVHAVVHTHSTFATTLACLRRPIPPFHYMVAAAGGRDIPCAPYATYGTQELSDNVVATITGRKATLLANHGLVAVGSDLGRAMRLAEEVEELAKQYWHALAVGEPVLLTREQMDEALARYASYGR